MKILAIRGDIPMGAGMSSSAALEVATALTIRRLFPYSLSETGATVAPKRNPKGELPPLPSLFSPQLSPVTANIKTQ